MTIEEYVDEIRMKLGYPVVQLEIDGQIPDIVRSAFREVKRSMVTDHYLTIPYTHCIDLSDKSVYNVTGVMRAYASENGSIDFPDAFYLAMQRYPSGSFTMSDYRQLLRIKQVKNTVSTDLEFIWDSPKLYVNATYPLPSEITIVYTPDYKTVDQITEPYWVDILLRLSLALSKQMLGRVRSKYKLNSANYDLDGDTLLNEASAELADIRGYLEENSQVVYPID